jgi:AraC-like DNA-binding protein/quercetin dioxygenase-like cupin family protein
VSRVSYICYAWRPLLQLIKVRYYIGMTKSERQKISSKRHDTKSEWRVLAKQHARGTLLPAHQHQTGQLVFALNGVMLVETSKRRWTIPPQRALWIPPLHPHAIRMLSHTEMRTIYIQPSLIKKCKGFAQKNEVHAIVASPLVKELVLGLFDERHGYGTHHLMARLLLQTLCETESLTTDLPMPGDERLRGAVMRLIATNDWNLPMQELASFAAMSERSFTRHFSAEVGLSFRVWRQRARIVASLDLLAANRSIKHIAHAMRFANSAAYVASFRELLGCTPHVFRR